MILYRVRVRALLSFDTSLDEVQGIMVQKSTNNFESFNRSMIKSLKVLD